MENIIFILLFLILAYVLFRISKSKYSKFLMSGLLIYTPIFAVLYTSMNTLVDSPVLDQYLIFHPIFIIVYVLLITYYFTSGYVLFIANIDSSKDKGLRRMTIGLLVALTVLGVLYYSGGNVDYEVNNFEDCVAAGNPIIFNDPRVCEHEGILYMEGK